VRKTVGNGFLSLRVSYPDAWALVVFWQSVLAAELCAAVGALEGHEGFLTASLAVHLCAIFSSYVRRLGL